MSLKNELVGIFVAVTCVDWLAFLAPTADMHCLVELKLMSQNANAVVWKSVNLLVGFLSLL